MRALVAAVLLLATFLPYPVSAADPLNVGQHLHWEVSNHPVEGFPIPRMPYTFRVTVKLHNQTAPAPWWRVDNESTSFPQRKFPAPYQNGIPACADCSVSFDAVIDFSSWSIGRHELRWHVDAKPNNDGQRQFTTSRVQVCIVSCTPNWSRSQVPVNGGGSWYLSRYATIFDLSPDTDHRPGGSVVIDATQDATRSCAFLNPDFHAGSSGTRLGCWNDSAKHTVQIPTTAQVGDRLVLFADQPNGNAGLLRVLLGDGSPRATTDYEFQSWWAKGGVVFP